MACHTSLDFELADANTRPLQVKMYNEIQIDGLKAAKLHPGHLPPPKITTEEGRSIIITNEMILAAQEPHKEALKSRLME
jgi:hypothetical protein